MDYTGLDREIRDAVAELESAEEGLKHLQPPDPEEEARIDREADEAFLHEKEKDTRADFQQIRYRIKAQASSREQHNERKRQARDRAVGRIQEVTRKFRRQLEADFRNPRAEKALKLLDKRSNYPPRDLGPLMVSLVTGMCETGRTIAVATAIPAPPDTVIPGPTPTAHPFADPHERPAPPAPSFQGLPETGLSRRGRSGSRSRDPHILKLETMIRDMKVEKLSQYEMCRRLDQNRASRPPRAGWRHLTWTMAYQATEHSDKVRKWLSHASANPFDPRAAPVRR